MESVKYWSKEFAEALVRELADDASFRKAARSFNDAIELRCLDRPDGQDARAVYSIDRGRVSVRYEERPAPWRELREAPFEKRERFARTTATYDLWRQVDQGEIGVLSAIRSPGYNVEGSALKVVAHVGIFRAMNAASGRIDKRYD